MQYQPVNLIIVAVTLCTYKLLAQKGTKSMIMFIMFTSILMCVPLAIIAVVISSRLSLGNAMGFKLISSEYNQAPNHKSTQLDLNDQSLDLSVLTSFKCSNTFPQFIGDFLDDTFTQNHDAILADMSTHHRYIDNDEMLPTLLSTDTTCRDDDACSTVFAYNKPYGVQLDLEFKRNETLFYCCNPMLNNPIVDVCNLTKTITDATKYNQKPLLLEGVIPCFVFFTQLRGQNLF